MNHPCKTCQYAAWILKSFWNPETDIISVARIQKCGKGNELKPENKCETYKPRKEKQQ